MYSLTKYLPDPAFTEKVIFSQGISKLALLQYFDLGEGGNSIKLDNSGLFAFEKFLMREEISLLHPKGLFLLPNGRPLSTRKSPVSVLSLGMNRILTGFVLLIFLLDPLHTLPFT